MGRRRKLPRRRTETGRPKCKKCGAPLLHIGRKELDPSGIRDIDFKIIKAGWGGQKLFDMFFCDECKRTTIIEVERY